MAVEKRSKPQKAESAPQITPMPFPGESPTVALAMAAGEKFGYHAEAKPARAKPKRKAAAKSKSKAKSAKPARKAKATKAARAKKAR